MENTKVENWWTSLESCASSLSRAASLSRLKNDLYIIEDWKLSKKELEIQISWMFAQPYDKQ